MKAILTTLVILALLTFVAGFVLARSAPQQTAGACAGIFLLQLARLVQARMHNGGE